MNIFLSIEGTTQKEIELFQSQIFYFTFPCHFHDFSHILKSICYKKDAPGCSIKLVHALSLSQKVFYAYLSNREIDKILKRKRIIT